MNHPAIAILDANILYPAPLRDLFIRLAQNGLIRARWTEKINDEWLRSILAKKPNLSLDRLTRTRELMMEAVRDCLVMGYESLIESLQLPDPNDRHILAAAIWADAEAIITFNLKDFPARVLADYHLEAIHPDHFLFSLLEAFPEQFCDAVRLQRDALQNPPKTANEFLETLENQGLFQTVSRLKHFLELL